MIAYLEGGTAELLARVDELLDADAVAFEEDGSWYVLGAHQLAAARGVIDQLRDDPDAPPLPVVLGLAALDQRPIEAHAGPPAAPSYDVPGARELPPSPGERFLRRTPHMEAPDQLSAGQTFTVKVWTSAAPRDAHEEGDDLLIEAPPDLTEVKVLVQLSATDHLALGDDFAQTLTIERENPESAPLTFSVTVANPEATGDVGLTARLLYRGRACGRVRREWSWPAGAAKVLAAETAPVAVHADSVDPDISVVITAEVNDGIHFTCSVRAPILGQDAFSKPEPWALPAAAPGLVNAWLAKFIDRLRTPAQRRSALRQAGRDFWKAAPKAFQTVLVQLIAHGFEGRPTIYVNSDEPVLPWELMLPGVPDDGAVVDRRFPLGVEFAVGRWPGGSTSPPQLMPVKDGVLIAPVYAEERQRLDPQAEKDVLAKHLAVQVIDAGVTYDALDAYFAEHDASVIHFVCHGRKLADDEVLSLDGDVPCTADELRDSAGFQRACGQRKPLVFINACDAGGQNVALGAGGSGFPTTFRELGARAVIAPLWPVTKFNAPNVAVAVYEEALARPGTPVAAILAELRERSFTGEEFDDSWAAYAFYGDPTASLSRSG